MITFYFMFNLKKKKMKKFIELARQAKSDFIGYDLGGTKKFILKIHCLTLLCDYLDSKPRPGHQYELF